MLVRAPAINQVYFPFMGHRMNPSFFLLFKGIAHDPPHASAYSSVGLHNTSRRYRSFEFKDAYTCDLAGDAMHIYVVV